MGTDNTQFHRRFRVWRRKASERSSTFSLRFTTISDSVSIGPRLKVGVLVEGNAWTPKSRIFVEDSSGSSERPWVSGFGSSGLQKVSSSLQEVGNLPTRVHFLSKYCFGLGWAPRAIWIVFSNTKIVFCLFGVVFAKLIFGLSLGRVLCHVYG